MSDNGWQECFQRGAAAPLGTIKVTTFDADGAVIGTPFYQATGCCCEQFSGATPEEARAQADESYRRHARESLVLSE